MEAGDVAGKKLQEQDLQSISCKETLEVVGMFTVIADNEPESESKSFHAVYSQCLIKKEG